MKSHNRQSWSDFGGHCPGRATLLCEQRAVRLPPWVGGWTQLRQSPLTGWGAGGSQCPGEGAALQDPRGRAGQRSLPISLHRAVPVVPVPGALLRGASPIVLSSLAGAGVASRGRKGPWSVSSPGGPGEEALGREAPPFPWAWAWAASVCGIASAARRAPGSSGSVPEAAPGLQGRGSLGCSGGWPETRTEVQEGHPREARPQPDAAGSSGAPVRLRGSQAGRSDSCTCRSCAEGRGEGRRGCCGRSRRGHCREGAGAS